MELKLITTLALAVNSTTMWTTYSDTLGKFIVGDEVTAVAVDEQGTFETLPATTRTVCNLPVSDAELDEFLAKPWHGFGWMTRGNYAYARGGTLLRTRVFGPDPSVLVKHNATGAILELASRTLTLFKRDGDSFSEIAKSKPKGKAALVFAAHPTEPLIVYGDNYGVFHAHTLQADAFGKATKISDKQRNATRVDFIDGGATLVVGGMGYLATFAYAGENFIPAHEVSTSVRDLLWIEKSRVCIVNRGMNGLSAYAYADNGFAKIFELPTRFPVNTITLSTDQLMLLATYQNSSDVELFQLLG